jgi:hypothetical protein
MIGKAIKSLYPDSEFAIENNDIAKIRWFKNRPNSINLEEIEAEVERLRLVEESLQYQQKRRYEYPPLTDLADALYWQAQGDDSKMNAYLEAVDTIKKKYPKGA